jgi:hypothetical protein
MYPVWPLLGLIPNTPVPPTSSLKTKHFGTEMRSARAKLLLQKTSLKSRGKIRPTRVAWGLRKRRRGSQVIVIHPGSRYMRIGRASDVNPITVPCVVARKSGIPLKPTKRVPLVSYPKNQTKGSSTGDLIQEDSGKQVPPDPVRVEYSSRSNCLLIPSPYHWFSLIQNYPQ